jgi:hypothetical protein
MVKSPTGFRRDNRGPSCTWLEDELLELEDELVELDEELLELEDELNEDELLEDELLLELEDTLLELDDEDELELIEDELLGLDDELLESSLPLVEVEGVWLELGLEEERLPLELVSNGLIKAILISKTKSKAVAVMIPEDRLMPKMISFFFFFSSFSSPSNSPFSFTSGRKTTPIPKTIKPIPNTIKKMFSNSIINLPIEDYIKDFVKKKM